MDDELIGQLALGEDSGRQIRSDVTNADSLAADMAAFANGAGGRVFIGVNDDGKVRGLSGADVGRLNQLISNAASQGVRPALNPVTRNVAHAGGTVLVLTVPKGLNPPYMTRDGAIWVRSGADRRRATSREEIQRMFQTAGLLHADQTPVPGAGIDELSESYFADFYARQYGERLVGFPVELPVLLANMNLMNQGWLNVAAVLLFGRQPQARLPVFVVKAAAFFGTRIDDDRYIDSRDIFGRLDEVFHGTLSFVLANTRAVQGSQGVNSLGEPEIARIVWEELIVNALVHRDYFISAPVRVLVFDDRVEIISPGHLPNSLTIENVKAGNSNIRNPVLASFAAKLLPYRGLGSGVLRALRAWPHIELIDDRAGQLFRVIVARPRP